MKIMLTWVACLAAFVSQAQQMLLNPGFEGTFSSGLATNWTKVPDTGVTMTCVQETAIVHGGGKSQKISVSGLSGTKEALLQQDFNSRAGHVYTGSVWLRASSACQVTVLLRLGSQRAVGIHTVTVGNAWQQVVMNGGWKLGGSCDLILSFLSNGTYWVDDASLTDVTASYLNAPMENTNVTIPATFFGVHINRNSTAANFPPINEGMIRLWDTGTRWSQIQVSNATSFSWQSDFAWAHMDQWVNTITSCSPNCKIIYTMGQSPDWAAAKEVNPPSDLNTWSNYVWHVATRYKGVIQYYELWNEVDAGNFYQGPMSSLVTMAQMAKNVLTNIDRNNKLIGPAVTLGGFDTLEQFLRAGGGQYQDIVTYHDYPTSTPEDSLAGVIGLKDTLSQYPQVSALPLWCTEGNPDTIQTGATAAENQGIACRAYLFLWTQNVQNFCWYCWDMSTVNNLKKPPLQSGSPPSTTPAPAGSAYRTLATWLVGATMLSRTVDANGSWAVQVQQPGHPAGYIVWNPNSNAVYNIPSSWNIYQQCDLSNRVSSFSSTSITVGVAPVLLVGATNASVTVTLSPATLPGATVGAGFIQLISASGGGAPYTFSVSSGSLPPGFTLFGSGVLSGTPVAPGSYTFSVTARDTNGYSGTNRYTLVAGCPGLALGPATLPGARVGAAFSQFLTAGGGSAPYSFAVNSGSLPPGLALSADGMFSGTPTHSGNYAFSVTVSDAYGCAGSQSYTLEVMGQPVIRVQPQSQTVAAGSGANLTVVAEGVPTPAGQWFFNSAPLPGAVGLSLTLTNFQSANEGSYAVLLTNALGAARSEPAGVYLQGPLRLMNPSVNNNGWFGAWVAGPSGTNFVVAGSSDLVHWVSLTTNAAPAGMVEFVDTNQNGGVRSSRFYRAYLAP